MDRDPPADPHPVDYRFSLANERTFLAWVRTSLALIAGGVAAAKAIEFEHDAWRWVVSVPPVLAGAALAAVAVKRWRGYEDAMVAGRRLPIGRDVYALGVGLAVYGVIVLLALLVDG
jgi:putative membrane protein